MQEVKTEDKIRNASQFLEQLEKNIAEQTKKEQEVIKERENAESVLAKIIVDTKNKTDELNKFLLEKTSCFDTINNFKEQLKALDTQLDVKREEIHRLDETIKVKTIEAEKKVALDTFKLEQEKKALLVIKGEIEVGEELLKIRELESKKAEETARQQITILGSEKAIIEKKMQEYIELKTIIDAKEIEEKNKFSLAEEKLKKAEETLKIAENKLSVIEKREKELSDKENELEGIATEVEADRLRVKKENKTLENKKIIAELKEK